MTIVGFEKLQNGHIKEYLPANDQLPDIAEQRQMFLHMYNTYVEADMKLSKTEMLDGQNIYKVFQNKIEKDSSQASQKIANLIYGHDRCRLLCDLEDMFLHLV